MAIWFVASLLLVAAGAIVRETPLDRHWQLALNASALQVAGLASVLAVLGLGTAIVWLAVALAMQHPRVPAAGLAVIVCGGLAVHAAALGLTAPPNGFAPQATTSAGLSAALVDPGAASSPVALQWPLVAMAGVAWPWRQRPRVAQGLGVLGVVVLVCSGASVLLAGHRPSDMLVSGGLGLALGCAVLGSPRCRAWIDGQTQADVSRSGSLRSKLGCASLLALACALCLIEQRAPLSTAWQGLLALACVLTGLRWWIGRSAPGRDAPPALRPAHIAGTAAD